MSRQLKRVPMSFAWPLKEIWGGYRNPYYRLAGRCPDCENGYDRVAGRIDANAALFHDQWYGTAPFSPAAYGVPEISIDHPAIRALAERNVGQAPEFYMTFAEQQARRTFRAEAMDGFPAREEPIIKHPEYDRVPAIEREVRRLHNLYRGMWMHHLSQADVDVLVAHGRLHDLTSDWTAESGWQKHGRLPTPQAVNDWSLDSFGHDAINSSSCVEARCKRERVPYECVRCGGSGKIWPTPEIHAQYEAWTATEPPTGDGFQLWEDVSEGSPVSPVFETLDALCAWAADHATTFGRFTATRDEWLHMLTDSVVHARQGSAIFL